MACHAVAKELHVDPDHRPPAFPYDHEVGGYRRLAHGQEGPLLPLSVVVALVPILEEIERPWIGHADVVQELAYATIRCDVRGGIAARRYHVRVDPRRLAVAKCTEIGDQVDPATSPRLLTNTPHLTTS